MLQLPKGRSGNLGVELRPFLSGLRSGAGKCLPGGMVWISDFQTVGQYEYAGTRGKIDQF